MNGLQVIYSNFELEAQQERQKEAERRQQEGLLFCDYPAHHLVEKEMEEKNKMKNQVKAQREINDLEVQQKLEALNTHNKPLPRDPSKVRRNCLF